MNLLRWMAKIIAGIGIFGGWFFPLFLLVGGSGLLSIASLASHLFEPYTLHLLRITLLQAGVSTVISVCSGMVLAFFILKSGWKFLSQKTTRSLMLFYFGAPTVVAGSGWLSVLSRNGVFSQLGLDWLFSLKAVVLAHIFFNAPWIALVVVAAAKELDPSYSRVAQTLGARRLLRFRAIEWPLIALPLAAAVTQVFSMCAMSFALVLLLGGGPPVETLEVAIYSQMRLSGFQPEKAAAFVFWQLVIGFIPFVILEVLKWRPAGEFSRREFSHGKKYPILGVLTLGALIILAAPYLSLLDPASLKAFKVVLTDPEFSFALLQSLLLAVTMGAITLIFSLSLIWVGWPHRLTRILSVAPVGLSTLALSFALWNAYERVLDPISHGFLFTVIAQAVLFSPLVVRFLVRVRISVPMRALRMAQTLGLSPLRAFFAIELRRWIAPVTAALGLAMAASLGESGASALFTSERFTSLPVLIAARAGQYRFDEARALALVLLGVCGALLFASARIASPEEAGHERA